MEMISADEVIQRIELMWLAVARFVSAASRTGGLSPSENNQR
jgi:hypothetical protein